MDSQSINIQEWEQWSYDDDLGVIDQFLPFSTESRVNASVENRPYDGTHLPTSSIQDPTFQSSHVYRWDHEEIRFRLPSGIGHWVIHLDIRGNHLSAGKEISVEYEAPQLNQIAILDGVLSTSGGSKVLIKGANFGPGPLSAEQILQNYAE